MLTIQSLTGSHDRKRFDCGKPALNEWLLKTARQHQEKDISQTFVAVDASMPTQVLGFYALSACEVVTAELPEGVAAKLPRKMPAVKLGRLAVDKAVQGQGLGALLLMDAIKRTCNVREHIGAAFGFIALPDASSTLVLPLKQVCGPSGR